MSVNSNNKKVIITIVRKGMAAKIVKASKEAGAEGGTIVYGLGTGVHETENFLGITLEPEKEMIITLIAEQKLNDVFWAIGKAGRLNAVSYTHLSAVICFCYTITFFIFIFIPFAG